MKIVAISDTHGAEVSGMPNADLLIHAGDWSTRGSYKETRDFINWMQNIRHRFGAIIVTPGNHDRWVETNQAQAKQEFKDSKIELLIDEGTNFMGAQIWGNPWSAEFHNWAFNADLAKRMAAANCIPDDISILITHAPPHGHLDKLSERGSQPGMNVGCEALEEAIWRVKPELNVFGHIHEGHGIKRHPNGFTTLVNASHMNEYYKGVNGFTVIEL